MQPSLVIVRLGELTLKGRNRFRFERQIRGQIERLLEPFSNLIVREDFGRIYLELNGEPYDQIASKLDQVFGIHSYSPAYISVVDISAMQLMAFQLMSSISPRPKTFKVSVRRINRTIPQETIELQRLLGGAILTQISGLAVDVRHPDLELKVEIRDDGAYFYYEMQDGAGGFPIGSNGKAMIMLSGGIDSPVAAWLAMRKGLALEAVHFHSYPYTSDRAKQKVIDLARRLSVYSGSLRLHLVPFTEIQLKLREQGQANLLITFMRRAMLRITERLAQKEAALGIVTGESLGQVASQTLSSLNTIGQVATLPLLRPLLMMDKTDIIQIAERIETYPISILPYEDCCTLFVPSSSSTNPNLKVVTRMEQRMTWLEDEMVRAIEQTETLLIKPNESKFSSFF